ncbi:MAG: hypothetical protein R6W75_14120 [Smithellaceae bacterium]
MTLTNYIDWYIPENTRMDTDTYRRAKQLVEDWGFKHQYSPGRLMTFHRRVMNPG